MVFKAFHLIVAVATDQERQLSAHELHKIMGEGDGLVLVDVRASGEFEAGHIEGAVNIPAPDLRTRHGELPGDSRIIAICSTGHRSSLAASLLKREGFKDVWNVAGGMMGYSAAGFAPACPMCKAPHSPAFLGKEDSP